MSVIGPDVSFYQDAPNTARQINFTQMKEAGAEFVIIRAGQNLWADQDVDFNMREAKAAGLPRGTYWFYDSRIEPKIQARLYIATLKGDLGELPLFADFEENYKGPYQGWKHWYTFLEELKLLARGHEIAIYTAPYYWKANAPSSILNKASLEYFHQYALWIAHYTTATAPTIPLPWSASEWCLWQYTSKENGPLFGAESLNIDMNRFNGSAEKFRARFNLGAVVTPPVDPPPTTSTANYIKMTLYAEGTQEDYLVTRV